MAAQPGMWYGQLPPGAVPLAPPPPMPLDAEMADVFRQRPSKKKKSVPPPAPVYYQPQGTRQQTKTQALSTKRRWSKQEDEKLCSAVKSVGLGDWTTVANVYMRGHDLSDAQCMHRWQKVLRPGLVKGAFCEKEDKVIVECLREGGLKRRWTKQEDEKLCLAVKSVGPHDWKRIAEQHLAGHGRSDVQCLHRWQKVLRAGLVKGAFTEEEDKIIIECMREGGLTWMQIAERIPGRIGKQCRERWTNHLDPNLKKGGWTHEEDTILAEAQQRWGNAWTKIAKLLPGRAENAVKNRWNSAFRRKKSAMFGKGPPQEADTATIARARTQMELIDRDEREPASDKTRAPKRAATLAAAPLVPARTTRSSSAPVKTKPTRLKTGADAALALERTQSMPAGAESPSTMLDLFGMKGGGALDFDGDALLALDDDENENALKADDGDALDVSFDALDMNIEAPLKDSNHFSTDGLEGFSPSKHGISDLFSIGRTGLTPSGPLAKTPAGGFGVSLSPLFGQSQRMQGLPATGASLADAALQLPGTARPEVDYEMEQRRPRCEFVSPNGAEYHAAWGLPAPRVQLPHNVSAILSRCASPTTRRRVSGSNSSTSPPDSEFKL